jgi:hypothetical protein
MSQKIWLIKSTTVTNKNLMAAKIILYLRSDIAYLQAKYKDNHRNPSKASLQLD